MNLLLRNFKSIIDGTLHDFYPLTFYLQTCLYPGLRSSKKKTIEWTPYGTLPGMPSRRSCCTCSGVEQLYIIVTRQSHSDISILTVPSGVFIYAAVSEHLVQECLAYVWANLSVRWLTSLCGNSSMSISIGSCADKTVLRPYLTGR